MKVLGKVTRKTLLDRERNEYIRRICKANSVKVWVLKRNREGNRYINIITEECLVQIARNKSPLGRKSSGRPRKSWNNNFRYGNDEKK